MIEVDNLRFAYPGAGTPTLNGVTLSVAPGEIYGLLGPSGAGKSTVQKILMGLLRGYSGDVRLFGKPIRERDRSLYERIGVSFELPTLYLRLTARENLELFAALYDRTCRDPREALALVGLEDAAEQRVETFSKGMKMRLNLCRALLHHPELMFLDEPTSGQDPARARRTRELIQSLKAEGKTVFLTTHNMAEAEEICDRVGFLTGGTIPVTGTPEALKREYGAPVLEVSVAAEGRIDKLCFPMDGIGGNGEFIDLLATGAVVALHTQDASLDDVFIRAAGTPRKAA